LFLNLNGWVLAANDVDCVLTMQALAAGEISESKFADWIRSNSAAKK
jgi:death-on-curing protein